MIFINVQKQAPCILLLRVEMNCFLCCLQFKGTNIVLTGLCLAACSITKVLFWLPSSLLAFLFQVLFLDTLSRCHAGPCICQSFVWQGEPDPF